MVWQGGHLQNYQKVLYLLRTLPIKIPQRFFRALQALQMRFIWAHKPPRIKFSLLTRSKALGGMGIPDFKTYYHATHIARILDWHCHTGLKDWVSLENDSSPIPLHFSPWIPKLKYPPKLRAHHLIGTTLGIFHLLTKQPKFSSPLSPLTPLQNNPDFIPGLGNHLLRPSDKNLPLLSSHCFNNKIIKDLTDLRADNNIPTLPLWTYFQVRSHVNNVTRKRHFTRDLTEMESVCLKGEQVLKTTSTAYEWLQNLKDSAVDKFRERDGQTAWT